MNVEEEEEEEEEEEPWEEVKRRRWDVLMKPPIDITGPYSWIQVKKKKKKKKKEMRQWDALPSTALLNIFCKSELKDRLESIPLVCKSWKYVTDDPRCWSSMIPDSVSPEDAFIKNTSGYKLESCELINLLLPFESINLYKSYASKKRDYDLLIGISRLFKEEGDHEVEFEEFEEEIEQVPVGLKLLRTLIKKSGGGAAITSLHLNPFCRMCYGWLFDWLFEMVLGLIANCCPNLKHISIDGYYHKEEALFQFFNKCKKLELVDLSFANDPSVIQEMGKCLPNLRGIRIRNCRFTTISIATYLPQLKLLSLGFPEDLSVTLFSCLELQYLYVEGRQLDYPQNIVDQASAQIPEFYFEVYHYESSWDDWSYDYGCVGELESTENMLECKETDIDNYLCIQKQRKEDQYVSTVKRKDLYVSILKNDQNVAILKKKIKYYHILKKKERDQCNSRLKKMKKKKYQYDSTLRKKKKDQCDYTDYVIRLKNG